MNQQERKTNNRIDESLDPLMKTQSMLEYLCVVVVTGAVLLIITYFL